METHCLKQIAAECSWKVSMKEKGRKFLRALLGGMLAITCGIAAGQSAAFEVKAEDEVQPPKFEKTLESNGDGTYTVSLSVTGTAESSTKTTKANVIVVLDLSGSMDYTVGSGSRQTRLDVAKDATNILADTLLAQNSKVSDMIELQLVTFANDATTRINWTQGTDATEFKRSVNNLSADGGTNWDAALYTAKNNAAAKNDGDDTYIIFVSDGNPTFYVGDWYGNHSHGTYSGRRGNGSSTTDNELNAAYEEAEDILGSGYKFYGIGVFGNVSNMQTLASRGGGEYYAANDEEALKSTFAKIASSITNAVGYENVAMTDAITNLTATSLVAGSVDENSFVYEKDGQPWSDAPKATYDSTTGVSWDLSDVGTLDKDVKYTVSFRVWPSQEAYDIVADLNNGIKSFDELTESEKSQIVDNGDGTYSLKSNPDDGFKATYTEVRTIEKDGETTTEKNEGSYTSTEAPGAMTLAGNKMAVLKVWDHDLQPRQLPDAIGMLVYEDGEPYQLVILNEANGWSEEINIAPGIMVDDNKDGTLEVLDKAEGHTYTVEEQFSGFRYEGTLPAGATAKDGSYVYGNLTFVPVEDEENVYTVSAYLDYHYDLVADPTHPMLDGSTTDNQNDFVDHAKNDEKMPSSNTGAAQYTATNLLKSGLNISKKVTETEGSAAAPADAEFTYEVTVTDTNGDDVWFSVRDAQGNVVKDAKVSGATAEDGDTGFWYFASGSTVTVTITADETIRFINLPLGTDYSITEKETAGFTNTGITVTPADDATTAVPKAEGKITVGDIAYEAVYTNNYSAAEVDTNTDTFFKKTVEGEGFVETIFHFTIAAGEGTPAPEKSEGSATFAKAGTQAIDFGKIVFTEEGEYTYVITETAPGQPWVVTGSPATVTVKVTKGEDGKLTATVTGAEIKNSYEPVEVDTNTEAFFKKTVIGKDFDPTTFSFTIAAGEGSPAPEKSEGSVEFTSEGTKTIDFGKLTFTKEGTYTYVITEKDPGQPWIVTGSPATVTVTVTADETGKLTATVTGAEIQNSYEPVTVVTDAEATAFVTKKVENANPVKASSFSFTLVEVTDETGATEVENGYKASGNLSFNAGETGEKAVDLGEIKYTKAGTYYYKVTEAQPADGWTVLPERGEVIVKVVVSADENGKLTAEVTGAVIINAYGVKPTQAVVEATKTLEGRPLENGEFTFTLTGTSENALGTSLTAVNDGGKVVFSPITYTAAGTYEYELKETAGELDGVTYDTAVYKVVVEVTDDGNGNLIAKVNYPAESVNFKNTFTPVELTGNTALKGTKTLFGRDMLADEKFEFNITGADEATTEAINTGIVVFNNTKAYASGGKDGIPTDFKFDTITFNKAGTYKFAITETAGSAGGVTYDSSTREITVTVEKQGTAGNMQLVVTSVTGEAAFENIYNASGTAALDATKILMADDIVMPLAGGEFSFEVRYANGPNKDVLATAQNNANGYVAFEPFTYSVSKDGMLESLVNDGTATKTIGEDGLATYTIQYVLTEVKPEQAYYQENTQSFTVTVEIKDNGDGTLSAAVSGDSPKAEFINKYISDTAEVTLSGVKTIKTNNRPLNAGEFTFTISAVSPEDAPLPEETTVANDANGNVVFPVIKFTKADLGAETEKVFTYTITEGGSQPGVTNDTAKTVTITVRDDGEGHIIATVDPEGALVFTFDNTYVPTAAKSHPTATKVLEGRPLKEGEFHFELKDSEGNVVAAADNAVDGSVVFDDITFEAAGEYHFTITETVGQAGGVTYDSNTYNVTAVVTDAYDGNPMSVVWNYGEQGAVEFRNVYVPASTTAVIETSKALEGRDLNSGEFKFELKDSEGNVIQTKSNDAEGKVTFDAITFDKVGEYTYTISEIEGDLGGVTYDKDTVTATVTVTDDENGQLHAVVVYSDKSSFVNTYKAEPTTAVINVNKQLSGRQLKEGEFSFELKNEEGEVLQTAVNKADGSVTFEALTFAEAGEYRYTVSEVNNELGGVAYDEHIINYTITVVDNLNGTMTATVETADETIFKNTYSTTPATVANLKFKKEMIGRELKANEFSFTLLNPEGTPVETVRNDAEGNVVFSELKFDKAGTYTYTVSEVKGTEANVKYDEHKVKVTITVTDKLDGTLEATVKTEGNKTFKNSYRAPDTGDHNNVGLWGSTAAAALMVAFAALFVKRKYHA